MDEKELLAIKDTLFKEKWVVSIYDSKVKRSETYLTSKGADYVTMLYSVLEDDEEFSGLYSLLVPLTGARLRDVTKSLETQGLIQHYYSVRYTTGISEEGYKRLYIVDWLLDKERQEKYRRKIAMIDGFDKGMKMVLKIMTGVVKFGQSMAPPEPKKKATPKKKTKPKRKTTTKRKYTPRQKTNAQHAQWSKDLRSFYEL